MHALHFDNSFSSINSVEKAYECFRHALNSMGDRLLVLQFTLELLIKIIIIIL